MRYTEAPAEVTFTWRSENAAPVILAQRLTSRLCRERAVSAPCSSVFTPEFEMFWQSASDSACQSIVPRLRVFSRECDQGMRRSATLAHAAHVTFDSRALSHVLRSMQGTSANWAPADRCQSGWTQTGHRRPHWQRQSKLTVRCWARRC